MAGRRVLVLGGEEQPLLCERLRQAGYELHVAPLDGEAAERLDAVRPDVILLPAAAGPTAATTRALQERAPVPVVWVIERASRDLAEQAGACGVAAVVRAGADPAELELTLEVACRAFAGREELRRTVVRLQEALATRKLVERAKGLLMDRYGLPEAEAYHRLRRLAMSSRRSLREVAEVVIGLAEPASRGGERKGAGS